MKRKRKKTERLNPSPRERKILSSGCFDSSKQVLQYQQQPLTLAQELKDSLDRYRNLRRIYEAEATRTTGGSIWPL